MRDRIVYLGPFNNHKGEELMDRAVEYLKDNKGDRFYYLLPNGELLKSYRTKMIHKVKKTFEINLFTFDDIVRKTLEEDISPTIDDSIKDLLMKDILKELIKEGEIHYYKDFVEMKGFIQSLSNIIGEIKRSLIYPKEYLKRCSDEAFYREIGIVYERYEQRLDQLRIHDREGKYFASIEKMKELEGIFNELDFIIIDQFYDFRPIELAILKELIKSNIDIYINIPFETEELLENLHNTIEDLKDLGFQVEYIEKSEKTQFESMAIDLLNNKGKKYDYGHNIQLIKSPNKYLELKRIFQEIKKSYQNGIELKDMSIVLLNEDYGETLFKVAEEEDIPLGIDRNIPLIEIPLIKEFFDIIQVKLTSLSKNTLINRLKSNYFPLLDYESRDELENIIRKQELKDTNKLTTDLKKILEIISKESQRIPWNDTISNYGKTFLELIEENQIEEIIYNRFKILQDFELLNRDLSALDSLRGIITDKSLFSFIVEDISLEEYYNILLSTVESEKVLITPRNANGVSIFNPINNRGMIRKVIFVVGLSKESYPLLKQDHFYFKDTNYSKLKEIQMDIKNYEERLINESLKFANILASALDKVYISYSESSKEEGGDIPSIFLDELLSLFKGEEIQEKLEFIELDLGYLLKEDLRDITTEEELSKYLLFNYYNKEVTDMEEVFHFYNSLKVDELKSINRKIEPELQRAKIEFNEYKGKISDCNIIEDIKSLHIDKVYSNSYLESYGRCPFAFFLNNIMNIEELKRELEDYSPIDVGNIYHYVLKEYYSYYKKDITNSILKNQDFNFEDTIENLKELVLNFSQELGLNPQKKSELLIIENIFDTLKDFIIADLKRIGDKKQKLIPYGFEVEFGRTENFQLESFGNSIKLRGVIDRIDKFIDEDKYIVMDYKSSESGAKDIDDMIKGLSLQLPIYILAQENKKVVIGQYGIIKDADFQVKLGILGESKLVGTRHKGGINQEDWNKLLENTKENIYKFQQGILSGEFSVNPLECSSYCIYKDICRYDRVLEVE